jgi:hypothetical protein
MVSILKRVWRLFVTDNPEQKLNDLRRVHRLMLMKAYGKTHNRPLFLLNPPRDLKGDPNSLPSRMEEVAIEMVKMGLCEYSKMYANSVVLTNEGMTLASILKSKGWPGVEKTKG